MNREPLAPHLTATQAFVADPVPVVRTVDPQAVYEEEYRHLVRLAVSLVDRRERAEEIVQDAVVRALARWARLDNPAAYLRTAVVNGCRNELRRRSVRRRRGEAELARSHPAGATADATAGFGESDALVDALALLSPKRRIAVTLRFYLDLSEADIAELLGVRPATVRSLVARGLADLRKVVDR